MTLTPPGVGSGSQVGIRPRLGSQGVEICRSWIFGAPARGGHPVFLHHQMISSDSRLDSCTAFLFPSVHCSWTPSLQGSGPEPSAVSVPFPFLCLFRWDQLPGLSSPLHGILQTRLLLSIALASSCSSQAAISSSSNSSVASRVLPALILPLVSGSIHHSQNVLLKHSFAPAILLKIKPDPFSLALRTLYLFNLVSHTFLSVQPAALQCSL